mmetsp:Transcript_25818/g.50563  ORF Transcript_25818/g.50563 Transcript_25818/m.50563 type:complete len:211 (-) Transcript_25818:99-731(-)
MTPIVTPPAEDSLDSSPSPPSSSSTAALRGNSVSLKVRLPVCLALPGTSRFSSTLHARAHSRQSVPINERRQRLAGREANIRAALRTLSLCPHSSIDNSSREVRTFRRTHNHSHPSSDSLSALWSFNLLRETGRDGNTFPALQSERSVQFNSIVASPSVGITDSPSPTAAHPLSDNLESPSTSPSSSTTIPSEHRPPNSLGAMESSSSET